VYVGEVVQHSPNKNYKDITGCSRRCNEHKDRQTKRGRDSLTYRHGEANTFILTTLRYGSAKRKEMDKMRDKTQEM
jgi:hypothetical protein